MQRLGGEGQPLVHPAFVPDGAVGRHVMGGIDEVLMLVGEGRQHAIQRAIVVPREEEGLGAHAADRVAVHAVHLAELGGHHDEHDAVPVDVGGHAEELGVPRIDALVVRPADRVDAGLVFARRGVDVEGDAGAQVPQRRLAAGRHHARGDVEALGDGRRREPAPPRGAFDHVAGLPPRSERLREPRRVGAERRGGGPGSRPLVQHPVRRAGAIGIGLVRHEDDVRVAVQPETQDRAVLGDV